MIVVARVDGVLITFVVTPAGRRFVPWIRSARWSPAVPVLKLKLPPAPKPRPETVSFRCRVEAEVAGGAVRAPRVVDVHRRRAARQRVAEGHRGKDVVQRADGGVLGELPTLTVFVPALPTKLTGSPVFDPRAS